MRRPLRLIRHVLLLALVAVVLLSESATAQTPTPPPQPAIQGAAIPAGGSSTFAGVTIVNRLSGVVTFSLANQVLSITATVGAPPFVVAPGSGTTCELMPPGAATGARCSAPPGTTITLIEAAAQAPMSLPRTGTGRFLNDDRTGGRSIGIGIVMAVVVGLVGSLASRRVKKTEPR